MTTADKELEFIEKFGLFFEKNSNFPRIAGKIFAYLMVSEPPEQTAKQIYEKLNISKSSVSSMMGLLVRAGIVEEISFPGDRSTYYRLKDGGWEELFLKRLHSMGAVRLIIADGRSLLKGKPKKTAKRLEELDRLYAFFEQELPVLITKWKEFDRKGEM